MSYKVRTESGSVSIDFSDLIYRTNMFIMENDSRSNYPASFDLINYMERILKPFMDERYKADIEDINRVEKPQGITPIQIQNNRRAYDKKTMDMKHEALMCLAFRNGFLGNKKTQAETQTMRDDHEQVL